MSTIEPYRRETPDKALYAFDADGRPHHNMALIGRAKKNWKTADLALGALYRFLAWPSAAGNDCFILANDEEQAGNDLVTKKIVASNSRPPARSRSAPRRSTASTAVLQILPARDVAGAHGKTYLFAGFDEIHGYRNHDLFEALAPDPTRPDVLTWTGQYAGIVQRRACRS